MGSQLIRKQVVFNLEDPYHRKLLKHLEQFPNFSGYVKRLIQRDMENGYKAPVSYGGNNNDADKALINGFI